MNSINRATLIGNAGRDPELRHLPNGSEVATISLATTESWKDKNSGDKKEETTWHNLVFYGRLAEIVAEYVKKGDPLYIEGRITNRTWKDKSGEEKHRAEIVVSEMRMLGGKRSSEGGQRTEKTQARPDKSGGPMDDFSDDIPF